MIGGDGMSLYNKIIGHSNIIEQLKNSVRNGKISNAYIFNGEDGAGKNMLADAFAESMLCEKDMEEGCGECHFCRQMQSGNNPDLISVLHQKAGSIGIDDIREQLNKDIQIKPYNGRHKVYIIDEAEKLTVQAQNAMLKTIEEPPEYGVIIFLTNNIEVFLPTIVSRCIVYNLRPQKESVVMDYMMTQFKIPEYEAKVCASFAQGKIGKAIELIKSETFGFIKDEAVNLLKNIYTYEITDILESIKKIADYKQNIIYYIDIIEMWYRDVLLFKVTKDPNNLIFSDEINQIRKESSKKSYEGIEKVLEGCETAKARLKANVNFELAIELMLLNIKEN